MAYRFGVLPQRHRRQGRFRMRLPNQVIRRRSNGGDKPSHEPSSVAHLTTSLYRPSKILLHPPLPLHRPGHNSPSSFPSITSILSTSSSLALIDHDFSKHHPP